MSAINIKQSISTHDYIAKLENLADLTEADLIEKIKSLPFVPNEAFKIRKKTKNSGNENDLMYRSIMLDKSVIILSDGTAFRTGKMSLPFLPEGHQKSFPGGIAENILGKGQIKNVFKVEDLTTHTLWAIAVAQPSGIDKELLHSELKKEYEISQAIDSPYVIKIQCFSERTSNEKQKIYMKSELCKGTLAEFPPSDNPEFFSHIQEGLKALHSYDIAHGDVHFRNILISKDGSRALIADFDVGIIGNPDLASKLKIEVCPHADLETAKGSDLKRLAFYRRQVTLSQLPQRT